MVYEWDEDKRLANLRKHGVDFARVEQFEWEHSITFEDTRERYHEQRWVSFGPVSGEIFVVVYSEPDEGVVRVISFRKTSKRERRLYAKEIQETHH